MQTYLSAKHANTYLNIKTTTIHFLLSILGNNIDIKLVELLAEHIVDAEVQLHNKYPGEAMKEAIRATETNRPEELDVLYKQGYPTDFTSKPYELTILLGNYLVVSGLYYNKFFTDEKSEQVRSLYLQIGKIVEVIRPQVKEFIQSIYNEQT